MDNDTSTTQAEIRVARNSVYGIVRLVMTTPLLFVLVPYMLRNLGPERYGVWALVGTLWALVQLGDLGLSTTVTKFVAALSSNDDTERINKVVTIAFIKCPNWHHSIHSPPWPEENHRHLWVRYSDRACS